MVVSGWDFTLGDQQLTVFKGKVGKGNCWTERWQKGTAVKLAVQQRLKGPAWVSPQDFSGIFDQKEEMPKPQKTQ